MVIPGETIATGAPATCGECGVTPKLAVLMGGRYHIGTACKCGPYSRESGYYKTRKEAEEALESGEYGR